MTVWISFFRLSEHFLLSAGVIFLAGAFGSTWAGFQSDKIGRKKSILLDLMFLMAGNTVIGMSKSFTVLMVGSRAGSNTFNNIRNTKYFEVLYLTSNTKYFQHYCIWPQIPNTQISQILFQILSNIFFLEWSKVA